MNYSSIINSIKRFPHSLSRKLIFLFISIALLFLFIVGASLSYFFKHHFEHNIKPHFFQYLEYVRHDIGLPANRQKAQALADKLNIDIVIIDASGVWSSDGRTRVVNNLRVEHQHRNNDVIYGEVEIDDKEYASMAIEGTQFLFDLSPIKHKRKSPRALMPLVFLLMILFLLYYATRKLFSPILSIQNGIKKIGAGDLQHRIVTTRQDELGELAENINNMAEKLQQMLDAKRQLLLAVSHELRSPLTRANVALEIMDDSQLTQQIKSDIQEMETLIADILEAERLHTQHNALEQQIYSIHTLLQELINDYFTKDSMTLTLPDNDLKAYIDKPRVKLLLKNIIANALRYQTNLTEISVSQHNNYLVIEVIDDGQGISADDIPHLTEPFYRVDPARQRQTGGYGLGLYLCKVIAEAHGGQLSIESQLNKGTKASIHLPLSSKGY